MEQVAKAAAVGMAAKRGEQPDADTTKDLLQSIQQWWNAQQQEQQENSAAKSSIEEQSSQTMPSPFWWWRHNRQQPNGGRTKSSTERTASLASSGVWATVCEIFWNWIDPSIVRHPSETTPTDIIDKILTSTPRLLAIANFLLAVTYLVHSAIATWFLGDSSSIAGTASSTFGATAGATPNNNNNSAMAPPVDWASPTRERMGGFLVFKLLLISAVVAPDTLDLLILLSWYTTLSCLRSLDNLAHATTTHLSALGQPPRPGVVHLLLLVLVGNILAAASCVALFHAAGWGMVLLLTCDCALLAADVLSHILKHFTCVLEGMHSQTIQSLEARQIRLHNAINNNNNNNNNSNTMDGGGDGDDVASNVQQQGGNEEDDALEGRPINDLSEESRRLDRRMEGLELEHARRLGIMDSVIFGLELLCHALTVAHFCHIWALHGVQFTLIDGVLALHLHSAISSACKKIAQRRNIHSIARDLHGLFPNASDQELRKASVAGDVCCICLGTMSTGGHVKKVPCGHLYHTHCLREVVERAQSVQAAKCPLCRSSLLDGRRQGDTNRSGNATPVVPQAPVAADANPQPPQVPGGGDHALFRFSTEGILPAWIPVPAFSFEVVRRPSAGATLGPPPPPVPLLGPQVPQPAMAPIPEDGAVGINQPGDVAVGADNPAPLQPPQPQVQQQEPAPSFLRRFLILAGAIPMSPEEEARALAQLVDMFPQYERSHLLRELRERGSAEAVAEAILMGLFTSGVPRGAEQ